MLILNPQSMRDLMPQVDLFCPMKEALIAIARENVSAPPRMSAYGELGKLSTMVGVADEVVVGKFISVFPSNHGTEIPSHQGCLVLFDQRTGTPVAIMDTGVMTAFRTAATTAVATDAIASDGASILTIVGSGVQGLSHYRSLKNIREWDEIRLVSRAPSSFERWGIALNDVTIFTDTKSAVEDADVVALCTSSEEPVIKAEWLAPHAHVSSVGGGFELDPSLIETAQIFVEWEGAAIHAHPAGAKELQSVDRHDVTLVGALLDGTTVHDREGRTIYKSTGHPAEDAKAAAAAFSTATRVGLGQTISW